MRVEKSPNKHVSAFHFWSNILFPELFPYCSNFVCIARQTVSDHVFALEIGLTFSLIGSKGWLSHRFRAILIGLVSFSQTRRKCWYSCSFRSRPLHRSLCTRRVARCRSVISFMLDQILPPGLFTCSNVHKNACYAEAILYKSKSLGFRVSTTTSVRIRASRSMAMDKFSSGYHTRRRRSENGDSLYLLFLLFNMGRSEIKD